MCYTEEARHTYSPPMARSTWLTSVHSSSVANAEVARIEYLMAVAKRNGEDPSRYRFQLIKAQAKR